MTQQLLERTVHDWVRANPGRGARTLDRLAAPAIFEAADRSTEDIADALIQLAGRIEIARTRLW
ncbi:MAG TPA: hypothetical protein VJM15_09295 [Sphingomicrobium sp.]|nr:hypothetical protein [Sphingomicrobium sp.]